MMYALVLMILLCVIEFAVILFLYRRMKNSQKEHINSKGLAGKNDRLFKMSLKWAERNAHSNCVYDYLHNRGIKKIIIYGMHNVGQMLLDTLKDTDIDVICGIDAKADSIISFIDIVKPEDNIPDADAIIVTAVLAFPDIDEFLYDKVKCPVISLEDIIYD